MSLLNLILLFITILSVNGQCDADWKYFAGTQSCFQYFHQAGNFFAADRFCQSKDAHLAILTTSGETEFVKAIVSATFPTTTEHTTFVGLTSTAQDCRREWLDGSPLNTSAVQLNDGEGNGCRTGHYCFFILSPPRGNYPQNKILADGGCDAIFQRTLCKKAANTYKPPVKTECDSGWTLYSETMSCFKNFLRLANFEEAKAHCAAFGGYLADIKTKGEAQFLINFVQQVPQRADAYDMPYIGLTAPNKDCDFRWLDGTPINRSIIDFTKFENNPNRCRNDQQCVKFYRDKWFAAPNFVLDDFWCNTRSRRLLCKKDLLTEPVEEEVKCLPGWTRLDKTNTCIQTRSAPTISEGNHLNKKCERVPMRSHFDRTTETCFVRSDNCYSVPLPAPLLRYPKYENIRRILERKGVLSGSSRICAFAYNNYCESGKMKKGENCFWETEKAGSWSAASNDCQKEGGTLFVPHNDRHMQNALEFLAEQKPKSDVVWLGLVSTDSWKSLDGSEVDYLRWRPVVNGSGPDDSATEASVFLYQSISKQDGAVAGYMRAENVKDSFHGLCSKVATDAYFPLERN